MSSLGYEMCYIGRTIAKNTQKKKVCSYKYMKVQLVFTKLLIVGGDGSSTGYSDPGGSGCGTPLFIQEAKVTKNMNILFVGV